MRFAGAGYDRQYQLAATSSVSIFCIYLQQLSGTIWICSGVIGFLLCAKEGPPVNFLTPVNPIEKIQGATKAGKELRFYNSEVFYVIIMFHLFHFKEIFSTKPV